METSRVNLTGLAAALIAGLVIYRDSQNLIGCLAGITLLIALLGFGQDKNHTALQSLAFGAVCGLAALDACSFALMVVVGPVKSFHNQDVVPPALWLLGTAIFTLVDRSGADSGSPQPVSLSGASYSPEPIVSTSASAAAASSSRPAFSSPAPQPVISSTAETMVQPPLPPPPPMTTGSTPAAVPPVLTGKEVSIYVTMMGEGMNVLRSVRAEHLGRDFYIIVEDMPADENWEFVPGQVVRCKKKSLSNGKGLVAFEEAPRAQ